uniref:Uncharacterized protein n=1 Tax=Timema douglasi TaxID=61478 RepID=A0A7R8Z5Y7_TIMDO|nr:unnamed protein product [Timema douglasi]
MESKHKSRLVENPFVHGGCSSRPGGDSARRTEKFQRSGRSHSAPGSYDLLMERFLELLSLRYHHMVSFQQWGAGPGLVLVALVYPSTQIAVPACAVLSENIAACLSGILFMRLCYLHYLMCPCCIPTMSRLRKTYALFDHKLYSKVCFDPPYKVVFDVALHISNTIPERSAMLFSLLPLLPTCGCDPRFVSYTSILSPICWCCEAAAQHQRVMRPTSAKPVGYQDQEAGPMEVHRLSRNHQSQQRGANNQQRFSPNQQKDQRCYRCDKEHLTSECPWANAICRFCKKLGHIERA